MMQTTQVYIARFLVIEKWNLVENDKRLSSAWNLYFSAGLDILDEGQEAIMQKTYIYTYTYKVL